MSRCFPFPAGYEKKARTDEVDLLKKEKHREKKHKKEKRDKEKKESKEKREKEGRDGKHKEKKDKKEKHRDKKKDKDKDKVKDKSKISAADEKGFPGQVQGPNAGRLHQKEVKPNENKGVLFADKLTKQHASNNGEKARENNYLAEENRDSKYLLELDRRIRDTGGGAGNQLVQKFTTAEHRKDEGTVRLVSKSSGSIDTWSDGKERLHDKGIDARKIDGRGIWAEARPIGNATVQNHAGNFHRRADEMPRPLEKKFDKTLEATVEAKEKVKTLEATVEAKEKVKRKKDDKQGNKRKDKEKEKKGHGKDKDRDKEKKKEEKAKENAEHKNKEQNKLKESGKADPFGSNSFIQVSRHSQENSMVGENLKKRKDIESNGVLHANDNWPRKLLKSSSSNFITENGRTLEPCQISLLNASDRSGTASNVKVDKINGTVETLPSAVSSNKTSTATIPAAVSSNKIPTATIPVAVSSNKIPTATIPVAVSSNKTPTATIPADPVSEASKKPPHPDTKYLSQVYSIPKADEQSDFDDQEWLFGSSCSQERKFTVKSSEVGDRLQVWAEVVHIEPADIFALPYVIPY